MEPCTPQKLPLQSLDWTKFIHLVGKANYELALYAGILHAMVNPGLLLSPLTTKEAVLSSKIEGTQATLEEVLEYQASPVKDETRSSDIREVINYRGALKYAVDYIKERPINLNLCKEIHYKLLSDVRGKDKARGEFRTVQNWIGKPNCTQEEARYVPPSPNIVMDYCSNLEQYIHFEEKDKLVQLAIVHAQFEIIHPFLDGNGRLGRILIPLFLVEKGMLNEPVFYISAYIDENRETYYDKLNDVTSKNMWEEWIIFFLTAVIEQSKANSAKVKEIIHLYEKTKEQIANSIRSQYSIKALDTIFENPIFNTRDFVTRSSIPRDSSIRILNALRKKNILTEIKESKGRNPSILLFRELLDITK